MPPGRGTTFTPQFRTQEQGVQPPHNIRHLPCHITSWFSLSDVVSTLDMTLCQTPNHQGGHGGEVQQPSMKQVGASAPGPVVPVSVHIDSSTIGATFFMALSFSNTALACAR